MLSILGGLALWELVSRFVVANPLFLAAPTQIVGAIWSLAVSGELWPHISVSAIEFAVGYVIASVLGIAIGMAMAESEVARKALEPWISGLYATPDHRARAAVHPVARHRHLVEGGGGDHAGDLPGRDQHRGGAAHHEPAARSRCCAASARRRGRSSSSCRCRRRSRSSSPGSKLGIGRGLIGVVVAELFGSRAGLGRLISQSADAFNMPELFAGVVILAVAGIVLTAGFSRLERRLVPWTRD